MSHLLNSSLGFHISIELYTRNYQYKGWGHLGDFAFIAKSPKCTHMARIACRLNTLKPNYCDVEDNEILHVEKGPHTPDSKAMN